MGDSKGNLHEQSHDGAHHHDGSALSEIELCVRALESLLVEKGYVDLHALDILIET
jgi:nitrile hydratase